MPSRRVALAASVAVLAACTSAPADDATSPPPSSASATPIEEIAVAGLEIEEPQWRADGGNWRLVLTWTEPTGIEVDRYVVRRDGVTVDDDVAEASFRDVDVEPGMRYRYEVVAVDVAGRSSRAGRARISTREPALADARLEGTFLVRLVVDRANGTQAPVRGGATTFGFDPACGSGACQVRWRVRKARAEGTLRRDGAIYEASLRTPLYVRNCNDRVIDESVDVRVRVTKAGPLRGAWRATAIEGTMAEVSSYGGCVTASIDWTVRGSLQT